MSSKSLGFHKESSQDGSRRFQAIAEPLRKPLIKLLKKSCAHEGNLLTTAILQVKTLVSNNQLHTCTYCIVLTKALPL